MKKLFLLISAAVIVAFGMCGCTNVPDSLAGTSWFVNYDEELGTLDFVDDTHYRLLTDDEDIYIDQYIYVKPNVTLYDGNYKVLTVTVDGDKMSGEVDGEMFEAKRTK